MTFCDQNTQKSCSACLQCEAQEYDMGEVPTVAQWVKNLTVVAWVAAEVQVRSPAQQSGLRMQHCCSFGASRSCSLYFIPSLGTSICCGGHQKKDPKIRVNAYPVYLFQMSLIHS